MWHPDMPAEYRDAIVTGDARELAKRIPDESVDLIFTDPPYPREYLPLYGWLAETAARVLKPGGSCLTMAGHSYLPDVMAAMGKNLTYHWVLSIDMLKGQGGQAATIWPRRVITFWKPILWYQNGAYDSKRAMVSDVVASAANDKIYHRWGQSLSCVYAAMMKFPGAVVFDPFAGGGTTAAVCKMLGRSYVAFEIDPDTAARARERVALTQAMHPVLLGEQAEMELAV